MNLCIQIIRGDAVLAQSEGSDCTTLVYGGEYREGDRLALQADRFPCHLVVQLEDSIQPALVYLAGARHEMTIPFGEKRVCYSPKSFTGSCHLLTARRASDREAGAYRNLARNPLDCHENRCLFPHAQANVETRDEAVFAARNAIDGVLANAGHGVWPYQSWGINRDPSAELRVSFGRAVRLDKAVLTTRADFPHDAWWVAGTLAFSDGSEETFSLAKTALPQPVEFTARTVEWVVLKQLIKSDDPSPFPALSQLELWGSDEA